MGRGPVLEKKKGLVNAAKGKVFAIHAKLIALAAQSGGDPNMNPHLHEAIEKAKASNVPNENIERAIKKGTGEDKTGVQLMEVNYEGYGPGGVAIIVSTITDNKNRTASDVRHIFSKFGGNMGEPGSVSFIFSKMGVIYVDLSKYDKEKIEELVLETEATDMLEEANYLKIITEMTDLKKTKDFLESKNIELESAKIDYIYSTAANVTDFEQALKLTKMLDSFEESDDTEAVHCNAIIDEELQTKVYDFIEKNTFKF
ncbi:MAG: YebC/PmpR family DNA-binding transcriptional regulator [Candidatus Gracilibacteria bacterium]|nr:YebC/PmpR family DNA-binding transcriptional regulator [Candidatus Gracilibacteria bacterium]